MADKQQYPRRSAALARNDATKRSKIPARHSLIDRHRDLLQRLRPLVEVTDDAVGDLLDDLRSDGVTVGDFLGPFHMAAYVRSRNFCACPRAIAAVHELWRRLGCRVLDDDDLGCDGDDDDDDGGRAA
jgi:hypothetical protein